MKSKLNTHAIAEIAVFGAISAVLLTLNFALPIAPSFYKLDFSDVPGLIGGFALGPMAAAYIELIKIIINIILEGGSTTAFVGEISNLLMSISFCVSAAYFYQKDRTKMGAVKATVIATLVLTVTGGFLNYVAIIPAYVRFMGFPLEAIIGMGAKIYPAVSNKLTLILLCTMPFNFVKGVVNSVITFLLYKRLTPILVKNR